MSDKVQNDKDREAVKEHFAGTRSIDDLTEAQIELAVDMKDAEDFEDVEKEAPPEEKALLEESVIDHDKVLQDALADRNRYKQLNDDKERKLNDLKTNEDFRNKYLGIEVKPKVDPEKDYLEDEHQARIDARLAELEERDRTREEESSKSKAEIAREKEHLALFKDISDLQGTYPNLKTTESFQSIDRKFVDWKSTLIANGVEEDKYFADAEYRKQKDAEGFKLDISQKNLDAAFKIYDIYKSYKTEVNAGYKSSIDRVYRDSSDYKELMKNTYGAHRQADDDALNSLIEANSKEVSLLGTGGAPADAGDVGVLMDELDILSAQTHLTPADKKRYNELDIQINLMTQ